MKTYYITFQTDLNASMKVRIFSRSYESAVKKVKKEYPRAFDID